MSTLAQLSDAYDRGWSAADDPTRDEAIVDLFAIIDKLTTVASAVLNRDSRESEFVFGQQQMCRKMFFVLQRYNPSEPTKEME